MKKLTKEQIEQIKEAAFYCARVGDEIKDLITKYNEFVEEWNGIARARVEAYDERINEILGIYEEAAELGRDYQAEKSDAWVDSEIGQAYDNWLSMLEDVEGEIGSLDIDLPDPLDEPDMPNWKDYKSFLPPNQPGE